MPKGQIHKWTPEEIAYLAEITPGRTRYEIYDLCQKKFDWDIPTVDTIVGAVKRHGMHFDGDGRFGHGRVAPNKGKKLSERMYNALKPTMFQTGNLPHNTQPLGTEVIGKGGYIYVKVGEDYTQPRHINWRPKHQLIWEKHHGPIPKNYVVIFLDGNKRNFDPDNLACISRGILVRMNQNNLFSDDPEITRTGIALAKLKNAIGKRKKDIK